MVKGIAGVTRDNEVRHIHEDRSIYLPISWVTRLGTPGKIPLEVIEGQTGSYLGEHGIVRMEDICDRN